MPKYPYIANRFAPYDEFVVRVQRILNYLRNRYHCTWPELKVDGFYGQDTASAVKGFQGFFTSYVPNGILDARTYASLEKARTIPINLSWEKAPEKESLIASITGGFLDVLKGLDDFIKEEIEFAKRSGRFDTKILMQRLSFHVTQLDPKMVKVQQLFKKNIESKNVVDTFDNVARKQMSPEKTFAQNKAIMDAQRSVSKHKVTIKYTSKQSEKIVKEFIDDLGKFNLLTRITDKIKQIGIVGDVKLGDLKNIKIKAGGVFLAWSLKDVIWDLLRFDEWGEDNWKEDLVKHCYEFLDNLIVGFVSTIIAQLIVSLSAAAIAATTAVTISGGWIIALVVVLALIIGFVIDAFIKNVCGEYASISKFMFEGAASQILQSLYSL